MLIDAIGFLGAAILIGAYWLVSNKRLEGGSTAYQLLNLTAGVVLIAYNVLLGAKAGIVINVFWSVIAIGALLPALGNWRNAKSKLLAVRRD